MKKIYDNDTQKLYGTFNDYDKEKVMEDLRVKGYNVEEDIDGDLIIEKVELFGYRPRGLGWGEELDF